MTIFRYYFFPLGCFFFLFACCPSLFSAETTNRPVIEIGPAEQLVLPAPYASRGVANPPQVVGWPSGKMPSAPAGFEVNLFADDLDNPRMIYVLPNGDVLVMESSPRTHDGRIVLLRVNRNNQTVMRKPFVRHLNAAFGMALSGNRFFIGNTDGVVVVPYRNGETEIKRRPEKLLDLPGGGNHFTRNLTVDRNSNKLYISVGSSTNVDEQKIDQKDPRRAAILQANLNGSGMRVFASGMRNSVGLDWEVKTKTLWTVVNERDMLGDELVPDYLTSVREGAFYGWPYSYFGQNVDPRKKGERPDLVAKAIKPDYALGSHVAPLGLAFYNGSSFPQRYREGAFIGMHGSWNRSNLVGYKVAFVPFQNGRPSGAMEDFLTGFVANPRTSEVYGRPVGVAVWTDGSLLVADDGSNKIWRVSVKH